MDAASKWWKGRKGREGEGRGGDGCIRKKKKKKKKKRGEVRGDKGDAIREERRQGRLLVGMGRGEER